MWTYTGQIDSVYIQYSTNNGGGWIDLVKTVNSGSYTWDVPDVSSALCLIKISTKDGISISDKSNSIFKILNCGVQAKFSYNENTLCDGGNIAFTNETSDIYNPGLNGISYKWYLNNNQNPSSTSTNFNPFFGSADFRTIKLEASYSGGCKNIYSERIYIKPDATAQFEYSQRKNSLIIDFVANEANATSYNWTYQNSIGTSSIISHTFPNTGTYNVCLSINAECGQDVKCKNIIVDPASSCSVNANFTLQGDICSKNSGSFTNNSSDASTYIWKVNGIQEATSSNFTYDFPEVGNYTITLIASNNNCNNVKNQIVEVHPNADKLNPSDDYLSCTAGTRNLDAGVDGMQGYFWKLNGQNVGGNSRFYTANNSGSYEIMVVDRCGKSATDNILIALNDTDCVYPGDLNFDGKVDGLDIVYFGRYYGARSDFTIISAQGNKTHSAGYSPNSIPNPADGPVQMNIVKDDSQPLTNGANNITMGINYESDANDGISLYAGHGIIDFSQFLSSSILINISLSMISNNSWLVDEDLVDMVYFYQFDENTKELQYGFTRLDGSDKIDRGQIGETLLEVFNVDGTEGFDEEISITGANYNSRGNLLANFSNSFRMNLRGGNCAQNITIHDNTVWQPTYNASNQITTSGEVEIVNEDYIIYNANRIRLNTGFSTGPWAKFSAHINPCGSINKEQNTPAEEENNQIQENSLLGIKPQKD